MLIAQLFSLLLFTSTQINVGNAQNVLTLTVTKTGSQASATTTQSCVDSANVPMVIAKLATKASQVPTQTIEYDFTVTKTISAPKIKHIWQTVTDITPSLATATLVDGNVLTYYAFPELTVCPEVGSKAQSTSGSVTVSRVVVTRPGATSVKSQPTSFVPVTRPGVPVTRPGVTTTQAGGVETWTDGITGAELTQTDPTVPTDLPLPVEASTLGPETIYVTITYAGNQDSPDALPTDSTLPAVSSQFVVHSNRFSAQFCKTMLSSAPNAVQGTCNHVCTMFVSTPATASNPTTLQEISQCAALCDARTGGTTVVTSCDNLFNLILYGVTAAPGASTSQSGTIPTDNGGAPVISGLDQSNNGVAIDNTDTSQQDSNLIPVDSSDPNLDQTDPTLDQPSGFVISLASTKTSKKTSVKATSTKVVDEQVPKTVTGNGLTKISRPTASAVPKKSSGWIKKPLIGFLVLSFV